MEVREFFDIPNFPNYSINKFGVVINKTTKKQLKGYAAKSGIGVTIKNDKNESKMIFVHRLMGITFLPNPFNYPVVIHKDGNVFNNNLENLFWGPMKEINKQTAQKIKNKNKETIEELLKKGYKKLVTKEGKLEDYLIGPYGEIFSLYSNNFLKFEYDKNGYLKVNIMISDGLRKTYRVPQLVLLTFEGPPPKELKDPTVNHIDGEKLNNYYKNLEWIERGVNSSIRFNKGAGELNHEAKLKEKDVENICDLLLNTNMTFEEIAKIFDVKKSVISEIKRQKKWTYITLKYPQLKHCRKVVHEENTGRFYAINPLLNGDKT